jgi:hypothetical protein
MTEWACGECTNGHGKTTIVTTENGQGGQAFKAGISDVLNDIDDIPEISFPVYGNKYMTKYMGSFRYFHLVDSPGIAFITMSDSLPSIVLYAVLDCLPLFLIASCLAFVAGCVIWTLVSINVCNLFQRFFVQYNLETIKLLQKDSNMFCRGFPS